MAQTGTPPDGSDRRSTHRGLLVSVGVLLVVSALVEAAQLFRPATSPNTVPPAATAAPQDLPTFRPGTPPDRVRSISVDLDIVTSPATDWQQVNARLDQVRATTVNLNAGRVEFTAFDWAAHPDVAAEPGTDHLALAARALHRAADGSDRELNLILDAYVPDWIKRDPSIAGVNASGQRSPYNASASELLGGVVGQRIVDYAAALAQRYHPNQIEVTELFVSAYSFGADDLLLFEKMTGRSDWPRTKAGAIDTGAAVLGRWRSEVLAEVMQRIRAAVEAVPGGSDIQLSVDVRVDWNAPAIGRPESGHDYSIILAAGVRLQLWTYLGTAGKKPVQIREVTAALKAAGYDMERFIISVGLWKGDPQAENPDSISPSELAAGVVQAETNGIVDVNVTPYSLLSDVDWAALQKVWA